MNMLGHTRPSLTLIAALSALVAGCGPSNTKFPVGGGEARESRDPYKTVKEARGSFFQEGGIAYEFSPAVLFGGKDEDQSETQAAPSTAGIQVNGYLWSAALDALSFMSIETADANAGIIKTGWYTPSERPQQRVRVNVFILSGELRDDGVRATVFRQSQNQAGNWIDAEPLPGTETSLESVIVERAKQLQQPGTG
jgi:hypothetical protein